MMTSLADKLPPEIARQIHPDWRKNEASYWGVRDQLLAQYRDQWIAFADGAVIAACKTSLEVLHTPGVVERHPFVICVAREDEPYRIRRATFAYDTTEKLSGAGRRSQTFLRYGRTYSRSPT